MNYPINLFFFFLDKEYFLLKTQKQRAGRLFFRNKTYQNSRKGVKADILRLA